MRFGCLTRPWNNLPLETCFDAVAAAGYDCIGLLGRPEGPIVGADTPPARVDEVRAMLAQRGLEPLVVWSRAGIDLATMRREIDQVHRLGAPTLLHCGVSKPEQYEPFYQMLRDAAPYAADRGITLALKPHGGITTTADDCLKAKAAVDRPNFVLWTDPGNLKYYANLDAVAETRKLAGQVAGCCVKDCTGSHPTGDGKVMLTPGEGEIDLAQVFRVMLDAGYDGPNMIECLGGTTPDEILAAAKLTKQRLATWFAR